MTTLRPPRPGAGRSFALLAAALAVSACGTSTVRVPPISPSPSAEVRAGQFVWYDLLTTDVEAARRFYGQLFGWTFQEGEADGSRVYTTILLDGRPIGGIAAAADLRDGAVNSSQWISNLSVGDVDAAVADVRRLGGTVAAEPRDLPDRGRIALVRDDQGALLALVRSTTGDPPVDREREGGWLWTELWTRDADASVAFYRGLVGYEDEPMAEGGGSDYRVFSVRGEPQAGLLTYALDAVQPNWLPYVLVDDPGALADRVEGLGGRVLLPPDPSRRNGSVAIIADPTGAALTIQKWPPEGQDR